MDKDKNISQAQPPVESPPAPKLPKGLAVTYIGIFAVMLIIPTIIWGALMIACRFSPELYDKINPPMNESGGMAGEKIAEFPTTFNIKTYTAEVEAWYDDHLPFRSLICNSYDDLKAAVEKPYNSTIRPALVELFHSNENGGVAELPEETIVDILGESTEPPEESEETVPIFDNEDTSPSDCEHIYDAGEIEVEPTCTEWGVMKYSCTKCSHSYREYTAKKAHDYAALTDTFDLVTCGSKYERFLKCNNCGYEKDDSGIKQHKNHKKIKTVKPSYTSYGYTLASCKYCGGEYRTDIKAKLYDTSYAVEFVWNNTAIEGRYQWLYYLGDNSMGYYQGTNLLTEAELAYYNSILVQLNEICKAKGITLQICIWPNKEQVYPEYYLGAEVVNEYKRVERLVDYIHENSDVKIIYPLAELTAAKPYWETYYKFDTHWNHAGGFIGHQAMLESLGLETTNLYNLPVWEFDRNAGDLISLGNLNGAYYTGAVDYSISYRTDITTDSYFGGDGANDIRHTTAANATNDCNFVMLADSYRCFQLDLIQKDFSDAYLCHRSQVNEAMTVDAIKNADVLVLAAVERYDYQIFDTAIQIINILSQE
ncbi:MAG: hypothetical protein IKJ07_08095 [Clostridia bacterium]|nr:hypothetical protein [Clostridia bacterium]